MTSAAHERESFRFRPLWHRRVGSERDEGPRVRESSGRLREVRREESRWHTRPDGRTGSRLSCVVTLAAGPGHLRVWHVLAASQIILKILAKFTDLATL